MYLERWSFDSMLHRVVLAQKAPLRACAMGQALAEIGSISRPKNQVFSLRAVRRAGSDTDAAPVLFGLATDIQPERLGLIVIGRYIARLAFS
jgi:hypothetical protein